MGRRGIIYRTNVRLLTRACYRSNGTPKVRWPNPTSAAFVADLQNWRAVHKVISPRSGKIPTNIVAPYLCPVCGGWHVARPMIPEWHHTSPERHPDLLIELGVRATAILWGQNSTRIRAEAGDTPESRDGRIRRPSSARARSMP